MIIMHVNLCVLVFVIHLIRSNRLIPYQAINLYTQQMVRHIELLPVLCANTYNLNLEVKRTPNHSAKFGSFMPPLCPRFIPGLKLKLKLKMRFISLLEQKAVICRIHNPHSVFMHVNNDLPSSGDLPYICPNRYPLIHLGGERQSRVSILPTNANTASRPRFEPMALSSQAQRLSTLATTLSSFTE